MKRPAHRTLRHFVLPATLLLSACGPSGAPEAAALETPRPPAAVVTDNGMAPRSIAGSKLHYSDLHSRNTYEFRLNGTFVFDYVHHGSGDAGQRDGTYRYRITSPGKARVDFGDGDFMLMEFDTPLSGTCVFDGDVRRYGFTLTRPDGE